MAPDKPCENKEIHNYHRHVITETRKCPGLTSCGMDIHTAHDFAATRDVWCNGVCGCGRKDPHGPGDHK